MVRNTNSDVIFQSISVLPDGIEFRLKTKIDMMEELQKDVAILNGP